MADEFDKFKARLLENPKIKADYDALAPEYELVERLITARKATKKENDEYYENFVAECLEDAADYEAAVAAWEEYEKSGRKSYTMDEVKAELGL